MNLYALGLEILAEKEKFYKAVKLQPSDIRYGEYLKYREEWKTEIIAMENNYREQCILYDNGPSEEVLSWKEDN